MYSVMIVDDDALFASVFASNFPWEKQGFCIVGHAQNGATAIQLLHKEPVDLAFVDMCMPGMNGPELISYIHQHFPETVCVALSNHDDFDFVKESFRAGATDYILKHCLNHREVQRILGICAEHIRQSSVQPSIQAKRIDPLSTSLYLSALLEGRIGQESDDYSLADSLHIPHLRTNLLVIQTHLADFKQFQKKYFESSRLKYILRTICSILCNVLEHHTKGVAFYSDADECFYSILTDDRFSDLQFLNYTRNLYIQQVSSAMKMYLNVDCSSVAAPLVSHIRDIRRAYLFLHKDKEREAQVPTEALRSIDTEGIYAQSLKTLRHCMSSPSPEDLRRYIVRLYENAHLQQYCYSQFQQLSVVLYRVYLAIQHEVNPSVSDAAQSDLPEIFVGKNTREMEEHAQALFSALYVRCKGKRSVNLSVHVQAAVDIINKQYGMPSLSLSTIARMVYVSDSYMSRSFKSEMGLGLSEYLNRFRIERAQSLMIVDQVSVKTASALCGFEDYSYFLRTFKKYTGLTPKDFRKKHMRNEEANFGNSPSLREDESVSP